MKRRSRTGGNPTKGRRRKTPEPKRRNAPKAVPRSNSSPTAEVTEIGRLTRELGEALERQTATSEVLNVISSAPGELDPVFNAILQNAARICQAQFGTLNLYDGTAYRTVALHNAPQNFARTRLGETFRPHPDSGLANVARKKQVIQIDDIRTRQPYIDGDKTVVELADIAGARTLLIVPMLNKEKLVGTISIYRREVRPFTDKQIELVKNFAAQAVVAIENARLLNELLAFERLSVEPAPGTGLGRMVSAKAAIQIADVLTDEDFPRDHPLRGAAERRCVRTLLCVPMIKEGELIGAISIFRQEVRTFTDRQIELVKNFAAQAVIAIENARLLNELRQRTADLTGRTADLTEALEQQTATSEVLQVISSSPGDLQPVFATMLEKAVRLCDATFGNIYRWDGEQSNILASHNTPPALVEARKRLRIRFVPKDLVGQAIANKKAVHIADLAEHQDYIERSSPGAVEAVEHGGVRTHVVVPMLKDDELIGTFHLSRQEVRPFTDKQIELVTNFAAQAVIAIENTRLLKELRERTEEVEKLNQHLAHRVNDQVGEIERMGRLRRFLPPQVADLIVASGREKQLESHRREITALFCDLRGFTGFSESADPGRCDDGIA